MARRSVQDCVKSIKAAAKSEEITDQQAEELLTRMDNKARERAKRLGENYERALEEIAGEIEREDRLRAAIDKRNRLLTIKAKRRIKNFVNLGLKSGMTYGESLRAFMEGTVKQLDSGRKSVDYQSRAIHGKYFGQLIDRLDTDGVLKEFRRGELELEVYQELGQLGREDGQPGITGSKTAEKIAKAIYEVRDEMITRQNMAGAYIKRRPGYITRQTHDVGEIRKLGNTKTESFNRWYEFILPLLDQEATFDGMNPRSYLRGVHEGIYTGVHGEPSNEAEVDGFSVHGSLAKKVSSKRVLHFKDPESAYKYNQVFGTKHIRDAILNDLLFRSRNIALMENLGPNPNNTFDQIKRELAEEARQKEDAAKQVESIYSDWRVQGAYNQVSGLNDIPENVSLNRGFSIARAITSMSKMGGVVLSAIGDKAFLQVEMARQGISHLDIIGKQISTMGKRSPQDIKRLRMMGAAMDGLMGTVLQRYSMHSRASGFAHRAQQQFFSINGMNWWNDSHKAAAAELMSRHLGEHSNISINELPDGLGNILRGYGINEKEWDVIRKTAYDIDDYKAITPDQFSNIPDSEINDLIKDRGLKVTAANQARVRNDLETSYRTYMADRIDMAVPTPGGAQAKYTTFDTKAGTPLGEAIRTLMMFKSFPITVFSKILGSHVYGNGSKSVRHFLMHDHKGKFFIAQLIAMTTIGGYFSGAIKDALKGRTPKALIDDEGKFVWNTLNDAALRGGGMGIMGDFLLTEYDRHYNSFIGYAAGPVFGQLDPLTRMFSQGIRGEDISSDAGKFVTNNTPYINLFYIRPVIDYFILWNIQEMMSPGSLERREQFIEEENNQQFFIKPSEVVNGR